MTPWVDAPGTVAALESTDGGNVAELIVEALEPCARCAAGKGCGAGLFTGRDGRQHLKIPVPDELATLAVGDRVRVRLLGRSIVTASLVAYGLPLVGLLLGALLAMAAAASDFGALMMSLAGLMGGLWLARRYSYGAAAVSCWRDGLSLERGPRE